MAKQIFINLAVADLQKSMDFYTAIGFSNNPQFSDDTAKCMVWSENIFVMLLNHEKFSTFTTRAIGHFRIQYLCFSYHRPSGVLVLGAPLMA